MSNSTPTHNCLFCHKPVLGPAYAYAEGITHIDCHKVYTNTRDGRPHPCPNCETRGTVASSEVIEWRESGPGDREYENWSMSGGGWGGGPGPPKVAAKYAQVACPLCAGRGYLEREPKKRMKFDGWERG